MDLIRCPGVLDKIFGPLGVHGVPNLGSQREQIAAMNFDYFDAHTCQFLFNLNTDSVQKTSVAPPLTSHAYFAKFRTSSHLKHIIMLLLQYEYLP